MCPVCRLSRLFVRRVWWKIRPPTAITYSEALHVTGWETYGTSMSIVTNRVRAVLPDEPVSSPAVARQP